MFMMKKLIASVLAAAMLTGSVAGCGGGDQQASSGAAGSKTAAAQPLDELTVNVGAEPQSLDPALNTAVDGGIYIQHVFEGLTKLDKNGKIVNGQAKDIKKSDDGLTYTVTLRDDIKWSDGKAVVAGDFVYAWQRLVDPQTASEYAYMMDPVVNASDIYTSKNKDLTSLGVTAKDDKTLEIKLAAPCAYFLELLSRPMFYPIRKDIV